MAANGSTAGVKGAAVKVKPWFTPRHKARNKPVAKQTREEIERALEAHERSLSAANEIRKRNGMEPLAENQTVRAWRQKLASKGGATPKRSPKLTRERLERLTPIERARALKKRRDALEEEREAIESEVRELVAIAQGDGDLSVSWIAKTLGLSRQRLYQVAG